MSKEFYLSFGLGQLKKRVKHLNHDNSLSQSTGNMMIAVMVLEETDLSSFLLWFRSDRLFTDISHEWHNLPFLSERACPESAISARSGDEDLYRKTEEGGGSPPRTATGTGLKSASHSYCQDMYEHRNILPHLESMPES